MSGSQENGTRLVKNSETPTYRNGRRRSQKYCFFVDISGGNGKKEQSGLAPYSDPGTLLRTNEVGGCI